MKSDTPSGPYPLSRWRWIVLNHSGGKDGQCALRCVFTEAVCQGFPIDRIVMSHQCLEEAEWPGTLDLVKRHSDHYGLRLKVSSYRTKTGEVMSLLEYAEKRGMWPDSGNRWCTSEFKRGPGGRVLTSLFREAPGDILNVYGFRAEESPARAKRQVFSRNARFSTKSREVWDWLPIRDWTKEQVWADIRASGVPHHYAYDFGMSRLSCVFCIFAPKGQLMLAARNNPELFGKYLAAEAGMGHSFRHKLSLREVKEAIDRGEEVSADDGKWNM